MARRAEWLGAIHCFKPPALPEVADLRPDSPCVDAGIDPVGTALTDLDGAPRRQRAFLDIGAYELPPPRLSAFQQSSQLVLFWPLTESGFVLQQAVDPMRSVWKPGGTAPAGDDRWSVQVPFTNPGPVFRLRKR